MKKTLALVLVTACQEPLFIEPYRAPVQEVSVTYPTAYTSVASGFVLNAHSIPPAYCEYDIHREWPINNNPSGPRIAPWTRMEYTSGTQHRQRFDLGTGNYTIGVRCFQNNRLLAPGVIAAPVFVR